MATLRFAGKEISVKNLLVVLKGAPEIDVSTTELNPKSAQLVQYTSGGKDDGNEIVVYRHEGQYLVLRGQAQLQKHLDQNLTTFAATLLTKHAYKRGLDLDLPARPIAIQEDRPMHNAYGTNPDAPPRTHPPRGPGWTDLGQRRDNHFRPREPQRSGR